MTNKPEQSLSVIQPGTTVASFQNGRKLQRQFVRKELVEHTDFGVIPGTKKKSLWQPGAEKLASFFGLAPEFTLVKEVEDFDKGFFYYKYKCTLTHFKSEKFAGCAERSCNSYEKKYLYKWSDRQRVKKDAAELIEDINTYQSMAQKRAFVAAVKTATAASEIFDERDGIGQDTVPQDDTSTVLLGRYFAAATERGFEPEKAKAIAYKIFNVRSMTELTYDQFDELYERLVTTFKVVGKGNKPARIDPFEKSEMNTQPAVVVKDEEEVIDMTIEVEDDPEISETENEKPESKPEISETKPETKDRSTCYADDCEKKPTKDSQFCSEKCKDDYWGPSHKTSKKKRSFEEAMKKMKRKAGKK